jgi:hypothetical protein
VYSSVEPRTQPKPELRSIVASLLVNVLILGGCASQSHPRLNFEGHSAIASTGPTVVNAVVTVRNTGTQKANVPRPGCPLWLAAYASAERNTEPLWRSGADYCISTLMIVPPIEIAPGDFYDFTLHLTLPSVLSGRHVFLSMRVPTGGLIPVGQLTVR